MHHNAETLLRRTNYLQELAHPLKAGLYAEPVQGIKKIKSFLIGHKSKGYLLCMVASARLMTTSKEASGSGSSAHPTA